MMISTGALVAIVVGAVVFFIILPLVLCCLCCGWCCFGGRSSKPQPVQIFHTQQQAPTQAPMNVTVQVPYETPQPAPSYLQHDQLGGQYSPGSRWNNSPDPYSVDVQGHVGNGGRGLQQQSQNFYPDQRYKPLTEFGLGRYQYPDEYSYGGHQSNLRQPRNHLGQSNYDIYQQPHYQQQRMNMKVSNQQQQHRY